MDGTKLRYRGIKYSGSARHWGTASPRITRSGFSRKSSTFYDFRTKFKRELKDLFGNNVSSNTLPVELAETPNGFIKEVLGLRQFLLRGLDKVRTEWLWACTAFNIRKLMIAMEKLRAEGSLEAA